MLETNNQKGREQYQNEYMQSKVVMDLTNKEIGRLEKKIKKMQNKIKVYETIRSNIKMLPVAELLIEPLKKHIGQRLFPTSEWQYFWYLTPGDIQYIENFWVGDNSVYCLIVYLDDTSSPDLSYLGYPTGQKIGEGSVAIGYREDRHHHDLPEEYDEITEIVLDLYSKENYELFLERFPTEVKLFT